VSTVLEAPERDAVEHDRTAFNLAVWDKILATPEFAAMPYRFETDEHGQIIMSPPPAPSHSRYEALIVGLLLRLAPHGETLTQCPVSTRKGVKATDAGWCSPEVWLKSAGKSCFVQAPEICVEVLSPSNTRSEIEEKRELYFEAGAKEVWICAQDGGMSLFAAAGEIERSALCPDFPPKVG
jgi:Uma2 family endonuclease